MLRLITIFCPGQYDEIELSDDPLTIGLFCKNRLRERLWCPVTYRDENCTKVNILESTNIRNGRSKTV